MLHDHTEVSSRANEMREPVIAMDPAGGSLNARFFLTEWANRGPRPGYLSPTDCHELTRECFNRLRNAGGLVLDLEHRLKFQDQCQAWRVRTS